MSMVRDFTPGRRGLNVDIGVHPAYDLILSVWALQCEDGCDTYELGEDWFGNLRAKLSDAETAKLEELGDGEIWIGLLSIVPELPENSDIDAFLDHLAAFDPLELRLRIIQHKDIYPASLTPVATAAAAGEPKAIEELISHESMDEHKRWQDSLRLLLEMSPEETRKRMVGVLRAFQERGFREHEAEMTVALRRDAETKRAMADEMSPDRLIEVATNGIAIEAGRDLRKVRLVPSVVIRPWVLITEHEDLRILFYPVAIEHLDSDPGAPPEWLVKRYKALGDERRLRILRRLSEGPASLQELADFVDVAKSTAHHHMVLLRTAGLVKITLGADKQYSLREEVLSEIGGMLRSYVSSGTNEANNETNNEDSN